MKDVLIPVGLLLFIGLFGFAMVHTARKQRKAKASAFRDFAVRNGLRYTEEDDGPARAFARDLDGIGRFESPSLGKIPPKNVVSGTANRSPVVLFRHFIRFSEGWAREWFVAGVTAPEIIADRCSVQFCKKATERNTIYLPDTVVKEYNAGPFRMVVRTASPSAAGRMAEDRVLTQLAGLAGKLSFRPEIQVRGKRLAAYAADRNAAVDDVQTLNALLEFAQAAARV